MAKPTKPLKLKRSRALVPTPTGNDLAIETVKITQALANDKRIKKYVVESDNATGITKIRAVGYNGQNVVQELLGPGLVQSTTSRPVGDTPAERRAARDENIIAFHLKNLSQEETAERLNCSQSLVSKVLRREGYR
ncbi:sigma-70 family RNA polymerase sigma factor [Novosphingobium sp. MBES04]|uniref:sigma-70 family RNA polymerase sigma factor n=1 Tax=Novosphingobium sp. MBES04 TaxID=1206458 RepID=UPI00058018CC|nr:sigma-70 family RNA polymerase sigma factor [Novosphingobium sp. MBES04]